jgi:hypothetical protein
VLPESIGLLALLDIPGRWGRVDAFHAGTRSARSAACWWAGRAGALGSEPTKCPRTRSAGGRGDRASRGQQPRTTRSRPLDRRSRLPVVGRAPRRLVGLRSCEVEHRVARWSRRLFDCANKGEPGRPGGDGAAQLRLLDLRSLVRGVRSRKRGSDGGGRAALPPRVPSCVRRLARDETGVESPGLGPTFMPQYRQPGLARAMRLDQRPTRLSPRV